MPTKRAYELVREAVGATDGSLFAVTSYLEDAFRKKVSRWSKYHEAHVWSEMKLHGIERVSDVQFLIEAVKEGRVPVAVRGKGECGDGQR